MGVRILVGNEQGSRLEIACLFDSVTGWAFGPVFQQGEDGYAPEDLAELFLAWLRENDHGDPRQLAPGILEDLYNRWRSVHERAASGAD